MGWYSSCSFPMPTIYGVHEVDEERGPHPKGFPTIFPMIQLHRGGSNAKGIVDTCQGDSGGPLSCLEGDRYTLRHLAAKIQNRTFLCFFHRRKIPTKVEEFPKGAKNGTGRFSTC